MSKQQSWYAHGKLLLTGEYLVMEGAKALALPVKPGQSLSVHISPTLENPSLSWTALKPDGHWFHAIFSLPDIKIRQTDNETLALSLRKILMTARSLKPSFLKGEDSFEVETILEFDPEFGLGSSSSLISNLAYWAGIDPFDLQFSAFGGSAYDVACARASGPVFYRLNEGKPVVEPLVFKPPFSTHLFFVYLGQKQRTTESISRFKQKANFGKDEIDRISEISQEISQAQELSDFEKLMLEHEKILAAVLSLPTVKERLFAKDDFLVKSLGAWGGDFVLVSSRMAEKDFKGLLKKRGYPTVFSWDELVF